MATSYGLGYKSRPKNAPNIHQTKGFAMLHRRPTAALIGLVLAAVLLAPRLDARAQTGIQPGVQPSLPGPVAPAPGAVAPAPNSVAPTSAQDLYTVRDVQVDVTASSAAAARDRAIAEA